MPGCLLIRPCRESDLPALGAWPHTRGDRRLTEWAYRQTLAGAMAMIVADHRCVPIGQIWIDLGRWPDAAILWALRVLPAWRGRGVGTLLITAAEREAIRLGKRTAEIAVEHDNHRARTLYLRLGYRMVGREAAVDARTGVPLGYELEVLRRRLNAIAAPHRSSARTIPVPLASP